MYNKISQFLANFAMMDIKFIRENKDLVREVIKNKRVDLDIEKLLSLDEKRREILGQSESIRSEQKKLGKDGIEKAKELKEKYVALEKELKPLEEEYLNLMSLVPNIYSQDTPIGNDSSQNIEYEKHGEIPKFDFALKDHIELGKILDIIDTEKGTDVSGFRGYFLKNEGVILQFALMMYAIRKLQGKEFQLMIPPTIIKDFALFGSGHFPSGKDNVYQISSTIESNDKEMKYLGGTSESALLAYFANQTIDKTKLPIKLCGFSQCFRSEIGSYGKDTKGLYRVHEFMKVEQIVIAEAEMESSLNLFEELRQNCQEMLEELGIPFRVLKICTGDMGAGKYKMYDLESWMPSRNAYGETHSDSHLTDWQARRLNIKYKDNDDKKFVYTLNNTMVASPRFLIALLENHQQADGSVVIPEALRPYTGFDVIKPKI